MASNSKLYLMTQLLNLEGVKVIDYRIIEEVLNSDIKNVAKRNDELDAARRRIKREAEQLKNKSKKEKEKLKEVEKVAPVLTEMHSLNEKLRNIFETSENWSEGLLSLADWLKDISKHFPKSFVTIKRWIGEIIAY